jgi:hypothetical protein
MMIKEGFTLLVALVAIPWANGTIQPGKAFVCPEIAMGSLFARKQAREATREESLIHFLSQNPTSEDLAGVLEYLELDPTGNKETRLTRLTAYIDALEEDGAQ